LTTVSTAYRNPCRTLLPSGRGRCRRAAVIVGVLLASILLPLTGRQVWAAEKTFAVTSGDWFEDRNWNPRGVPTAADSVVVPGGRTVSIAAPGPATVRQLTLFGTIDGSGSVEITDLFDWARGSMRGSGTTRVDGELRLANASAVSLRQSRTLKNVGTARWSGANFANDPESSFDNEGTFLIETDADFSSGQFNNTGTVIKSAGNDNGVTRFTAVFNNAGTLEVESGVVELDGGGTHTGTASVAAEALLEFGAAVHGLEGGSVSGSGSVRFGNGFTELNGGLYAVAGTTTVVGGVHVFGPGVTVAPLGALTLLAGTLQLSSGASVMVASYTQRGGVLSGSDDITIDGLCTWTAGSIRGSGILNANGGFTIAPTEVIGILDTRVINNGGDAATRRQPSFGSDPTPPSPSEERRNFAAEPSRTKVCSNGRRKPEAVSPGSPRASTAPASSACVAGPCSCSTAERTAACSPFRAAPRSVSPARTPSSAARCKATARWSFFPTAYALKTAATKSTARPSSAAVRIASERTPLFLPSATSNSTKRPSI
jgi:hypothetical protein